MNHLYERGGPEGHREPDAPDGHAAVRGEVGTGRDRVDLVAPVALELAEFEVFTFVEPVPPRVRRLVGEPHPPVRSVRGGQPVQLQRGRRPVGGTHDPRGTGRGVLVGDERALRDDHRAGRSGARAGGARAGGAGGAGAGGGGGGGGAGGGWRGGHRTGQRLGGGGGGEQRPGRGAAEPESADTRED